MKALVFPGQGSQRTGMGRFYHQQFKTARTLFEEASDTLKISFQKLCFEGSREELKQTENAQPAIVLVSTVAWLCLKEEVPTGSLSFSYTAGHSVGEYSALVAAGVLDFSQALKLVRQRGQLMKAACPPGRGTMMALLGPSAEQAQDFCRWVGEKSSLPPLEPAGFNAPTQTVLSGPTASVKWACGHLQEYERFKNLRGVRALPLEVGGAFHSSLMEPAALKMKEVLKPIPFREANPQVVQNVTAAPVVQPEALKANLIRQIPAPVLWHASIKKMIQNGVSHFVELGEGKTLAGLMRQIHRGVKVSHFHSLEDLKDLEDRDS